MTTRLDVVGQSGLNRMGGDVNEEWHRKLRGRLGVRAYREMRDNSAVIGASIVATSSLIRQVPWPIEPADTPRGEEAALFLEECLGDMSHTWPDFMAELLSCIWFGWSYFEKVFKFREGPDASDPSRRSKYDDGKIGWRKFGIRAQETLDDWEFDDEGGIRGMWQCAAPDYNRVFIPIEKSMLFRTELNKNNPEGRSMLRNAWRSYYFLKRMQEIEAVGTERDLVGYPFALMPIEYFDSTAPPDKKQLATDVFNMMKKMRRNEQEALVFPAKMDHKTGKPTGFEFGLLASGGSRQLDIAGSIIRYEKRIAMVLSTHFMFLGMDKAGSFALSSDMTSLFATGLGAILDSIEATLNRFAVAELMQLNGFAIEDHPRLVHGDIEKEDMIRFADLMTKLSGGGLVTADATLEDFIRTKMELPDADEPEEDADVFGADRDRSEPDPFAEDGEEGGEGEDEDAGEDEEEGEGEGDDEEAELDEDEELPKATKP